MLADTVESAVRSLGEVTPSKIDAVVHNMAMKRLQDEQFDECDLSLRELSQIEASISKTLASHYHGRIAYPTPPDAPPESKFQPVQVGQK
jgi:membrane-associated HD superfamily phosphohydrolase